MYKNLIISISLCLITSVSYAQTQLEQKTLLINTQDKIKVQNFQEGVKVKIEKHRAEMHTKKEVLEHDKENLLNDIKLAKQQNNGTLTEEQKTEFKNRRDMIENKIVQLHQENTQFMANIDKEREMFFSQVKNKK